MHVGHTTWVIPEGYIPSKSTGPEPQMTSHDSLAILNTGDSSAEIDVTIYYTDREPVGPYHVTADPRRSLHVRINNLTEPEPVPLATEYSILVKSSVPVVVQYTRLDSRQAENALLSVMAYPVDEDK